MHNLNVTLAATAALAANSLLVESGGTTPRTPEILNSLIAMTNPMDGYQFGDDAPKIVSAVPRATSCASSDSNSSSSSQVESPVGNNPPSVQHTCSQLIKAGLKLTIEQKRKQTQSDCDDFLDLDSVKRFKTNDCSESEDERIKQEPHGLTPEDEERRRRRRERNKIAATKCRLKKRERTANLIHESETLESQNIDLKNQLQELRSQEQMLLDVLSVHRPQCQHNIGPATRESLQNLLPPVSSVIEQQSFGRPARANSLYRSQETEAFSGNSSSIANDQQLTYNRSTVSYNKAPCIVVEDIDDYDSHEFINLDAIHPYYPSSPCHNYSSSQNYGNSQGMDNGCMA
ncbi:activating transcription factor 3 [Euwallacea fornicatus]|uniref:activating transcription factor 3 n=1 Tax=Euwallacea fornicatus TaxID=995702 RepID=UPI00338E9232